MRAVRFGSYSIAATLAGTPNFSRRKSMRRYCRLWPPPRYRAVIWPLLLRPPVPRRGSTSDFSGFGAWACTRNAYSFRAWNAAEDFSVITGPTIKWCCSGILGLRLLGGGTQRRQLGDHRIRPQDLVRGGVGEPHHVHLRQVAARQIAVVRVRRARRHHQHLLLRHAQLGQ